MKICTGFVLRNVVRIFFLTRRLSHVDSFSHLFTQQNIRDLFFEFRLSLLRPTSLSPKGGRGGVRDSSWIEIRDYYRIETKPLFFFSELISQRERAFVEGRNGRIPLNARRVGLGSVSANGSDRARERERVRVFVCVCFQTILSGESIVSFYFTIKMLSSSSVRRFVRIVLLPRGCRNPHQLRLFSSEKGGDEECSTTTCGGDIKSFEERLEICKACEHGKKPVYGYPTLCDECGCSIQAKAFFETFHCPIEKW